MSQPDPKAAILAMADDVDMVPLEGIDGAYIRRLSIAEMDRLASIEKDSGAHLLAMAICDVAATPIFSKDDVPALTKLKAREFKKLAQQVTKHNRMDEDSSEEAIKN